MIKSITNLNAIYKRTSVPIYYFIGCLLLSLPIFSDLFGYADFYNHLWLGQNYVTSIIHNFSVPLLLNNDTVIGDAQPLFYGRLTHTLLALPSVLFGSYIGGKFFLVLLMFGLVAFAYQSFTLLFQKQGKSVILMLTFTAIISDYMLTDLYNRGAITEYVSYILLLIAILFYLQFTLLKKIDYIIPALFFATASMLAHPLTIIYVVIIFLFIVTHNFRRLLLDCKFLLLFPFRNSRIAFSSCVLFIALAVILSPILLYQNYTSGISTVFALLSFDNIEARLLPGFLDYRLLQGERFLELSTPLLSACINVGLLIIIISILRGYKLLIFLFILILLILLTITDIRWLPSFFLKVQFPYRYNILVHVWLLCGFIIAMFSLNTISKTLNPVVLGVALGVTFVLLSSKTVNTYKTFRHLNQIPNISLNSQITDAGHLIDTFYGRNNFIQSDFGVLSDIQPSATFQLDLKKRGEWSSDFSSNIDVSKSACLEKICTLRIYTNITDNPVHKFLIYAVKANQIVEKKYDFGVQKGMFFFDVTYDNSEQEIHFKAFVPRIWLWYSKICALILVGIGIYIYFFIFRSISVLILKEMRFKNYHSA